MPTFATPEPIALAVDITLGAVHLIANDRTDTVVTVNPSDPTRPRDVEVAKETEVDHADGRVSVASPRPRGFASVVSGSDRYGSVEVVIELPSGSDVEVEAQVGAIRADGRLGRVTVKTAVGDIRVDDTGPVQLETSTGTVALGRAIGRANVRAVGDLHISAVEGDAEVKNSLGTTWIGEVSGDLRVRSSNGGITIERTRGQVEAKTANGAIRVDEVSSGSVALATSNGRIDVGIATGTAAWVDAYSKTGRITRELEDGHAPGDGQPAAEIRARTSVGDITIHRA